MTIEAACDSAAYWGKRILPAMAVCGLVGWACSKDMARQARYEADQARQRDAEEESRKSNLRACGALPACSNFLTDCLGREMTYTSTCDKKIGVLLEARRGAK